MTLAVFSISQIDWTWVDTFRLAFVVCALMLVGMNIAFIRFAKYLFTPESCLAWRFFFAGKTMVTLSVAAMVWDRVTNDLGVSPATYLAASGVVMSNIALGIVYRRRDILLDHVVTHAEIENGHGHTSH